MNDKVEAAFRCLNARSAGYVYPTNDEAVATIRAHIEALEAMSEKRRVTLITMTEDRTAQRRRAEAAEARVRELEGLLRDIRPALACEDTYHPCSDLRRRIDSAMQGEEVRGG